MSLRYGLSKAVYIVLLEVALVVDLALAIAVYKVLEDWLGKMGSVLALTFGLSSILGVLLYLLHMWQLEYLTKGGSRAGKP